MKESKKAPAKGAVAALLLLLLPGVMHAAPQDYPDSLWNAGTAAYADGRWQDALDAWTQIDALGIESADLSFNMGNACFKLSDYAHAILNYERALKLDPSSADIKHNLQYANEFIQDNIEPVPDFFLKEWFRAFARLLNADAWAVLFLVLLALGLGLLLLFFLGRSAPAKKAGFYGAIIAAALCLLCLASSRTQYNQAVSSADAIIVRAVTSVKSSPSGTAAKDLFILHEGAKVHILDSVGEWLNVELPDGRQGWLPQTDLEIL